MVPAGMANVLGDEKRHQILTLGRLGWSLRRIEKETAVRWTPSLGPLLGSGKRQLCAA